MTSENDITFLCDPEVTAKNPGLGEVINFDRDVFKLRRVIAKPAAAVCGNPKAWPWSIFWYLVYQDLSDQSWWGFYLGMETMQEMDVTSSKDASQVRQYCGAAGRLFHVCGACQYAEGVAAFAGMHPAAKKDKKKSNLDQEDPGKQPPLDMKLE